MRHDRNRKREGAKVADGLAHLHAHQSEEMRKNEDQRDEEGDGHGDCKLADVLRNDGEDARKAADAD